MQKLNLYNNNAENAINDLIREINEKLNNFIAQIKSEFENLLNQIIQKLQEMEGLIRDNINFSFKILNQFNDSFFKNNKILLGSIAGETVITTAALGIASELSSSIAFGGLMGGLIGLGVGAVVGGIILGIRTIYKKYKRKEDFKEKIQNYHKEYNEIYEGITSSIINKKNGIKDKMINSIHNLKKFLTEDINLIPIDNWNKVRKEFDDLIKDFEKAFKLEELEEEEEENMLGWSYQSVRQIKKNY